MIEQLLEDLFGIPSCRVEESDDLRIDWGLDDIELSVFDAEFCAEHGVEFVPSDVRTVGDYARLVIER